MKNFLVLSSAESDEDKKNLRTFCKKINENLSDSVKLHTCNYKDLFFKINSQEFEITDCINAKPLNSYDFVYFKAYYPFSEDNPDLSRFLRITEAAVSVGEYLSAHKVPFVCSEIKNYISFSKLSQYARLSLHNMPIPDTFFFSGDPTLHEHVLTKNLGFPLICKAINASQGAHNYLVNDINQLKNIIIDNPKISFVCQKFIPNSHDLRLLVVGGKLGLIIKRQRQSDDTHLNNTSQGARAFLLEESELPDGLVDLALKAAKIFSREISGVDIIVSEADGQPYILEVNASPQISTGAFPEEKFDLFADYFRSI